MLSHQSSLALSGLHQHTSAESEMQLVCFCRWPFGYILDLIA